jgi:hypothetical protein
VVLLLLLLAAVIIDPFSGGSQRNMSRAYGALQEWTQAEVAAGKLPQNTAGLLQEAWRLRSAGDKAAARKAWTKLSIYLAGTEAEHGLGEASQRHPRALSKLVNADAKAPPPGEEEMGAAVVQFVNWMAAGK